MQTHVTLLYLKKEKLNKFILFILSFLCLCFVIFSWQFLFLYKQSINDAKSKLEERNYQVNIYLNENSKTLIAYDELNYACVYYFNSERKAKEVYEYIYNAYLAQVYSPDIYGYKNSAYLYYGKIEEPVIWDEYQTLVNWDLLNHLNINYHDILFPNKLKAYRFPMMELPNSYDDFLSQYDYYMPKCYQKGKKIFVGSIKILNIIS